jgi:hypothetical protein
MADEPADRPDDDPVSEDLSDDLPADVRGYEKFSKIEGAPTTGQTSFSASEHTSPPASGRSPVSVPTSGPKPVSR